jgi:hypothetical protein
MSEAAIAIGVLYRKARTSSNDRPFYLSEAGKGLIKCKESLGHKQWQSWIRAHEDVLGFNEPAARSLIQGAEWLAANWQLANQLEEIVTNPCATVEDLARAAEIRQLISFQFRPKYRGTIARRRNEWYTPLEYISRARAVLGDIDLDPASCEQAQRTVKAKQYFDKEQNGLHQPWYGRVWLNSPYQQPTMGKFISKLISEWNSHRVSACIALTHNFTDAMWFHDAISAADCVCFTQGRIKFQDCDGGLAQPTQGQAFFYFGPQPDAFKHEFGRIGFIVRPEPDSWSRQRVRQPEMTNA